MKQRVLWLLIPVLWVVAAVVGSAPGGRIIDNGKVTDMPWATLLIEQLVAFGWWAIVTPLVIFVVTRIENAAGPLPRRLALHFLAAIAFVLLHWLARSHIHLPWSWTQFRLAADVRGLRSILPNALATYLLIASVTAGFLAHGRALARERRATRLETQLAEARLHVLRAQLHPHFLFNSLNAVSALVDWRPKEARRMLVRLSELLRMALELSEQAEIPLAQEMDWLERYLELQQIRYDERLRVDIRVAAEAISAAVPPLILQPLVENAIKHAIEPRPEGGRVEIVAERDGARLRLRVRDDGPGPSASTSSTGTGIGLRNTRDRLAALHGEEQRVELRMAPGGGAEVVVQMPFREAAAIRLAEPAPAPEMQPSASQQIG